MDILAHTLWTTAAARKANRVAKKKGKLFKLNLFWTAFWGVFPDLFAFSIPFVIALWTILTGTRTLQFFSTKNQVVAGLNLFHDFYQYSHSLIIFAVIFLIVWAIKRRPPWVLLGWVFHILIDIPSHSLAFFPTPFLFRLSNYHFPYGIAWSNMWFMIINYSALLIVWGTILVKKYHKPKDISLKA
jgi:hypothetical protein